MDVLDLKIGGMHCDGCADRIQSLLEKSSGIQTASVSFQTGKGMVYFRPRTLDEEQIITMIERAGFTVDKE